MLGSTLAAVTAVLAGVAPASPPVVPHVDPPFADQCVFAEYGEGEAPAAGSDRAEPTCVEYAKRDITVDNGGAVEFLLAEPERVAYAVPACRYWQRDHWSVQASRDEDAVVRWDGSYWFDKATGEGAAALRHFTVAGQPVGVDQAADALRPLWPELADLVSTYGSRDGGGVRLVPLADPVGCPPGAT